MRTPLESPRLFSERRRKIGQKIQGSALIVGAPLERVRNGSVHFPFRQDSDLYYLTGFEEPESILVLRPGLSPETVLFVRKKDATRETWDGFRFGPEATQEKFQIDVVYPVEEFSTRIVELLKGVDKVYYRYFLNEELDHKIDEALKAFQTVNRKSGKGILPVFDAHALIGESRLFKTEAELANHRRACEITAEAHNEVMRITRPGMNERELHGYFIYQIMKRGAAREGYNGIFATGANACTLHYVFNDCVLKVNDLLLVDAGAEYNYFTGDITRTFPVTGRFTEAQAEVYTGVLDIQKKIIEGIRPGITFQSLQDQGAEMLTDLMLELGLLTGRRQDVIKTNEHKKYYPHGIGHWLGMDVHDVGAYVDSQGHHRVIEPGMVFTIEPGLYIPVGDPEAAEPYRGIGIRIEDNILVTAQGHENLTVKAVKEIADIEKLVGSI